MVCSGWQAQWVGRCFVVLEACWAKLHLASSTVEMMYLAGSTCVFLSPYIRARLFMSLCFLWLCGCQPCPWSTVSCIATHA